MRCLHDEVFISRPGQTDREVLVQKTLIEKIAGADAAKFAKEKSWIAFCNGQVGG
jgi:hypothetical protein